jgi:hypothetical protein
LRIPDPQLASLLQCPTGFPERLPVGVIRHVHATEKRRRTVKTVTPTGQSGCICNQPCGIGGFSSGFVDFGYTPIDRHDPGTTGLGDHAFPATPNIRHPAYGHFLDHHVLLRFCKSTE